MKVVFTFFFLVILNCGISQSLTYTFAGSDANKTQLKCGESRKIKLIADGLDLSNLEYHCLDTTVLIKKLNTKILDVKPTRLCQNVEIIASKNGRKISSFTIPVYCKHETELLFFGVRDGDTLSYSKLISPLDLILHTKFTEDYIEVVSFVIYIISDDKKAVQIKCESLSSSLIDKVIRDIKEHNVKSISIINVKANRTSPITVEVSLGVYPGATYFLK